MYKIITLMALVMSIPMVQPDGARYIKPINLGSKQNTAAAFKKPINVCLTKDKEPFIPLSEKESSYDDMRFQALNNCKYNKNPDPELIDALISIEKKFDPPASVRGMLLAAACMESGFNPNAKGDRKFSKDKRTPRAIGILQMWSFYEKKFPGLKRTDPEAAADAWMQHIVSRIPSVKKQCKYRTDDRVWLAAWVTGIRYKKKGGRCNERPKHFKLLRQWQRNIKRERSLESSCDVRIGCGC